MHDDIEILSADFATRIDRHLADFDLVGIAGTTRLVGGPLVVPGVAALDGVFMAMRREVATAIPFDAQTFAGFHLHDLDFSFRAHRGGFRLAVCRDVVLIHESAGTYDAAWEDYRRRFEAKHRDALASIAKPKTGARAALKPASRKEVVRRTEISWLIDVADRIGGANAGL